MKWYHSQNLVKKSLDFLPSGICFADSNGIIILCNHRMHNLFWLLAGTDLQHICELREALSNPQPGIISLIQSAFVFRFPNGEVWEFKENKLSDNFGNIYTEMQAFELTKLYGKVTKLEEENRNLEEFNNRAKGLYMELEQIVQEEESFSLKTGIHNSIGLRLLSTHQALSEKPSLSQLRELGSKWHRTIEVALLSKHFEQEDNPDLEQNPFTSITEAMEELIGTAEEIGLTIVINGIFPKEHPLAYLLIISMRECAINAVRHGKSSEMTVQFTETEEWICAQIYNNGTAPRYTVKEGGGLSDLRNRIEKSRGIMKITSSPTFQLNISLPRKEVL